MKYMSKKAAAIAVVMAVGLFGNVSYAAGGFSDSLKSVLDSMGSMSSALGVDQSQLTGMINDIASQIDNLSSGLSAQPDGTGGANAISQDDLMRQIQGLVVVNHN